MLSVSSIIINLVCITIVITIHEFTKAAVSTALGDPLPRSRFRVTLNPISHIEPIGFILMLMFGFGWGKPVDVSPVYYKDKQKGILMTFLSPVVATFALGLLAAVGCRLLNTPAIFSVTNATLVIANGLLRLAHLSMGFAIFNLIPIYPLDGAKIITLFISPSAVLKFASMEKLLQVFLMIALVFGVVGVVIDPIVILILRLII